MTAASCIPCGRATLSSRRSLRSPSRRTVCAPPHVAAPVGKPDVDLSSAPPFTLTDIRNAIPSECWERNAARSFSYLIKDVAIVLALAAGAYAVDSWFVWPLYWLAQGTMFWALFVVGHDCGHQSFSSNQKLNNFVGNIIHASILVPYHGWRISHRKHHTNHGHVENDESWHPLSEQHYDRAQESDKLLSIGRLTFPFALFAFPFYLWTGSPGRQSSHYDPEGPLFRPTEKNMIVTSNAFMLGMVGVLAACTFALGPAAMFKLYFVPYWINVMWLDIVTYLHHHGTQDGSKVPWYRGEEWSYLRGGLSTLDRDYGIFNKIHHDIGTHVVHHLFPLIPHYNLEKATEAVKPVMGDYYRPVEPSPGPLPTHLVEPLVRSFREDKYVPNEGDIVFYQGDKTGSKN